MSRRARASARSTASRACETRAGIVSRKYSASSSTSSPRSRSGGMVMGTAEMRKYRSSRNVLSATAARKSLFVAVRMRTFTSISCVPPTRSKRFSSSTRSSLL